MKPNLKDYTYEELQNLIHGELGEPKFRADQIFSWMYRGADSFDEMTNLSKSLREKLSADYSVCNPKISEKFVSSLDETARYLLQLEDGNYIESVLMHYRHGNTICISSQVGCAMGCAFCASTRLGKARNLTSGEIIGQILAVEKDSGEKISNVVMMGIGEPLDNYEQVMRFLKTVNHPKGLNIGHRHISLSTCGLVPNILKLAEENLQITLSISLHAVGDEKRSALMPVNRKYPISELLSACAVYFRKTGRRISFEYTLIDGVNDTPEEAAALRDLIGHLNCHVNLIPVNPVKETGFRKGSRAQIEKFQHILEQGGISTTIRREMGSDIRAACGQLRASATQS